MNIPTKYRALTNQVFITIVASQHHAIYYQIADGEINQLNSVHIDKPQYSDREGMFKSSGPGASTKAGAPLNDISDLVLRDFSTAFEAKTKEVLEKTNFAYLVIITPSHLKSLIISHLPKQYHSIIKATRDANLTQAHPLKIVEFLDKELTPKNKAEPLSPEVRKILSKQTIKFKPA